MSSINLEREPQTVALDVLPTPAVPNADARDPTLLHGNDVSLQHTHTPCELLSAYCYTYYPIFPLLVFTRICFLEDCLQITHAGLRLTVLHLPSTRTPPLLLTIADADTLEHSDLQERQAPELEHNSSIPNLRRTSDDQHSLTDQDPQHTPPRVPAIDLGDECAISDPGSRDPRYRVILSVTETSRGHGSSPQKPTPNSSPDGEPNALDLVPMPGAYDGLDESRKPTLLKSCDVSVQYTSYDLVSACCYLCYPIRPLLVAARICHSEGSILVLYAELPVVELPLPLRRTRQRVLPLPPAADVTLGPLDRVDLLTRTEDAAATFQDAYSRSLNEGAVGMTCIWNSMELGLAANAARDEDYDTTLVDPVSTSSPLDTTYEYEDGSRTIPGGDVGATSSCGVPIDAAAVGEVEDPASDSGDAESYRDLEDTLLDILPLFSQWDSDHGSKFQLLREDSDELDPTCASTPANACIAPELFATERTRHECDATSEALSHDAFPAVGLVGLSAHDVPSEDLVPVGPDGRGDLCAPEQEQQAPEPEHDSSALDVQRTSLGYAWLSEALSSTVDSLDNSSAQLGSSMSSADDDPGSHGWDQDEDVRCSEEESSTVTEPVPFPSVTPPFSPSLRPQPHRRSHSFGCRADDIEQQTALQPLPFPEPERERASSYFSLRCASAGYAALSSTVDSLDSSSAEPELSTSSVDDAHTGSHEWDQNEDVQCSEEDSSTLTSVPFPCVSPPFSPTLGPQCSRSRSNSFGWRADDIAPAFAVDEAPSEAAAAPSGDATASSPLPILFLSRDNHGSASLDHRSKPPLRTSSTNTFCSSSSSHQQKSETLGIVDVFESSTSTIGAPESRPTSLPLAVEQPSRDIASEVPDLDLLDERGDLQRRPEQEQQAGLQPLPFPEPERERASSISSLRCASAGYGALSSTVDSLDSSSAEPELSTSSVDDAHTRSHEWDQNEDVQCSEEDSSTLTSVPFPCVSPPFSPTLGPQCSRSRSNSFGWRADDIAAAFTIDEVPSEVAAAPSGDTTASSPVPILFLSCYSPSPDHNSKPPLRTSSFSASSASTAAPDSRPTSLPLALDPPSRDKSRKWWQKIHPKRRVKKALAAMRASHHDNANNNLTPVNGGPDSDSRLPQEENHRHPGNASMQAVRAKSGPRRVPSKALSFLSTTSRSSGKSSATSTTVAAHVVPPGSLPAVDARQLPWYV
ncbi:hypothetical protein C8Q80DRAFT_251935 [Daedaleopsis nitida]|nr:hypothetical protein C8Q80DRAFT_251935 [Daedaleopsis nitida]